MKEKKESSNWYVAGTHWLTSTITSVVIGIALFVVATIVVGLTLGTEQKDVPFLAFLMILIMPLAFWLGAKYSAKYISKKYIIRESKEIIKLATIYLVVVGGGYRAYTAITEGGISLEMLSFVLGVIAFYFASKKYVHNTNG